MCILSREVRVFAIFLFTRRTVLWVRYELEQGHLRSTHAINRRPRHHHYRIFCPQMIVSRLVIVRELYPLFRCHALHTIFTQTISIKIICFKNKVMYLEFHSYSSIWFFCVGCFREKIYTTLLSIELPPLNFQQIPVVRVDVRSLFPVLYFYAIYLFCNR